MTWRWDDLGNHDRLNSMLLASVGVDPEKGTRYIDKRYAGWEIYAFRKDRVPELPVLLVKDGPKSVNDAKKIASGDGCILIFRTGMRKSAGRYRLLLKSEKENTVYSLENKSAYRHAATMFQSHKLDRAQDEVDALIGIKKIIRNIHADTGVFINKGVFSTHYLNNRLFGELKRRDIKAETGAVAGKINGTVWEILDALGWKNLKLGHDTHRNGDGNVSLLVVKDGMDLDILQEKNTVSPSYRAIAELDNSDWVILTNKRLWRLYTRRVSASTTSYFQIDIEREERSVLEYLVAIFGALTYEKPEKGQADIDAIFEGSTDHATGLEEDLADKIVARDGVFMSLVKGIIDYDPKKRFSIKELDSAKETALKVMYRVLFLLYAESRDLLPVKDERYGAISLERLRAELDSVGGGGRTNEYDCWARLLDLFDKIRHGDPKKNLPQYNGELFRTVNSIDRIKVKNKFIVKALRGLFEKDGEYRDYAELSVRHIGNIYEQLLELGVRQTERKIAVLKNGAVVDMSKTAVKKYRKASYFYKEGELYIILKGGFTKRKLSASYYTPEEIVKFLVKNGLAPIFKERESMIKKDLIAYKRNPSGKSRLVCVNRLLDIQVLDPAMGSGHFLVEALNQITSWAARMLDKYPSHPILQDIESDRTTIIEEMHKNKIKIDKSRLTQSALLKRKVLKRCIFGVDLNKLAVDLVRLSLWLDSFVMGMPLTYVSHHIKQGDSTIGMRWKDRADPENRSLDDWTDRIKKIGKIINKVSYSADTNMSQVRESQKAHLEYEEGVNPYKSVLDVLAASKMYEHVIPNHPPPKAKSH